MYYLEERIITRQLELNLLMNFALTFQNCLAQQLQPQEKSNFSYFYSQLTLNLEVNDFR